MTTYLIYKRADFDGPGGPGIGADADVLDALNALVSEGMSSSEAFSTLARLGHDESVSVGESVIRACEEDLS